MEAEAHYKTVGATLVCLVLAVVLAMVWLARTGARADFRYYTIYFERQSLEGLQVGGDVNIRGVKVGRVEQYSISRDNINLVRVTIRIDKNSPVSTNTVAVVDRNILTGLARINLVTPGRPGPELTDVRAGEDYPVIAEGHSDIEQLTGAMNRLAITGAAALTNMEELLDKDNRDAFKATLANLRELSSGLAKRVGRFDEVALALEKTATDFGKASREIAAGVDNLSKSAQPVANQADVALRDLSKAAQALERATTTLSRSLDAATHTGVLELRATAQELRASAEILARAADRLQDPRAVIFGPNPAQLGPGEQMR
jgi:phospholipid/cholesterol/gamma-HCH transport system substrate-binding protein